MKKILLCVLSACAFIGITGCSSEKKVSAEEAKTVVKNAIENTQKKIESQASITSKNSIDGKITSNDVKLMAGTSALFTIEKTKINVKADTNETLSYNINDKKAKITANGNAKVSGNVTSASLKNVLGWDSPKKLDYTAKGNGEVYYIDGETQANIYAKYDAELNDQVVKDFNIPNNTFTGKYNFKTVFFGHGLFDKIFDDETEEESSTTTTTDFIKDWTIFKKKGKTYIADCSNLEAFDFGEDFTKVQNELKNKGIVFKISKFQFELNDDTTFKDIDFTLSLDGNVDLSKLGFDAESYADLVDIIAKYAPDKAAILKNLPVDALNGTLTLDLDLNQGLEFGYTPEAISVPADLANLPETDLDQMIIEFIFGKPNAAKQ